LHIGIKNIKEFLEFYPKMSKLMFTMDFMIDTVLPNGLFIFGTLILLWSIKRWLERRDWK